MKYRPWGPLEWVLSLSSPKKWYFFGAIGTEERSICSWSEMYRLDAVIDGKFAEIIDVDSIKYRTLTKAALQQRRSDFLQNGGKSKMIQSFDLMTEMYRIINFSRSIKHYQSVVLDISSFPKRFFFLILKDLLYNSKIKNLIITYTYPESYVEDEPLYENIESWKTLPGFGGSDINPAIWIVSVGFLVESLRRYIGDNPHENMKILIPFPASLASLRRTWLSVADLERGQSDNRFEKFRVDPKDISAAFDRICSITGEGKKHIAFAPFGPKPTAAAMCIYALQKNSSIHYAQPTVYHPEYSKGILENNPTKAVNAYWIKHNNEILYSI